jgi:hypothetical protein
MEYCPIFSRTDMLPLTQLEKILHLIRGLTDKAQVFLETYHGEKQMLGVKKEAPKRGRS